jgi:lactate dehydrogenase-like 2-hydroxyacid dehydrogenase
VLLLGKMKILYPWPPSLKTPDEHRIMSDPAMERLKKIAEVDTSQHPSLERQNKAIWAARLQDVEVIGYLRRPWNWDEFLDLAPALRLIQGAGIGYDHIDVAACTQRGVMVCNVAEIMSESVAQHAMALILDLSKKITLADRRIRETENWAKDSDRVGFELWGKTLGIIGLGGIGGRLAMKCRTAFNMRILAYDPNVLPSGAQRYGATLVDLATLLQESDVIEVSCFLTRKGSHPTYHLLGEKEFNMVKQTAILVNIARGGVIDEPALINALQEGKIAAAGLDVFETEPLPSNSPLRALENAVLTAHQSSSTIECRIKTPAAAIENVIRYVQGEIPYWVVNRRALLK